MPLCGVSVSDLIQARLALAQLEEERAPTSVIAAAKVAIEHAEQGLPVPSWAQARLLQHAALRQQQNRWGK